MKANHKLTIDDVRSIRTRYKLKRVSYRQLADEYGVALSTIHKVIKNKTFGDEAYAVPIQSQSTFLTINHAQQIRYLWDNTPMTRRMIASKFQVSIWCIRDIVRNKTHHDPNYVYYPR